MFGACKQGVRHDWTSVPIGANVSGMIDTKTLDDLAGRLAGSLPASLQLLQDDLKKNLRANLEAGLAKLDLVTREEFDVRTREKLTRLEAKVQELERKLL